MDIVCGMLLLAGMFLLVQRFGWPWGGLGVWANLLWFIYQNQWGSGWMPYLQGLGLLTFLAAGYRQYGLVWALLPWPLLLYIRLDVQTFLPYLPAWGEGLMLGVLLYLLTGTFKRP